MIYFLVPVGIACVLASLAHGYLGQTRLIAPAKFPSRQAAGFVAMIWQFSTLSWAASGVLIAITPWVFPEELRFAAVSLAVAPIIYGVAGNFIVSRGRHFGWMLFAAIISAALLVVALAAH